MAPVAIAFIYHAVDHKMVKMTGPGIMMQAIGADVKTFCSIGPFTAVKRTFYLAASDGLASKIGSCF